MGYKGYTIPPPEGPNGDRSDFPEEVFRFFLNPSARVPVTEKWLQDTIGKTTIQVHNFDIYSMGKRKKDRSPAFWTRMRIVMREAERNVFQGNLGVRFTGGFGLRISEKGDSVQMMRPVNIRDMVTEDVSDLKKRSAIHLGGDSFIMLCEAGSFCEFPFYTTQDIQCSSRINCRKKKYYARKMEEKKQWPHITRKSVTAGNKNKIFKMLLPYRKNLPLGVYFDEFSRDINNILSEFRREFNIPDTRQSAVMGPVNGPVDTHNIVNTRDPPRGDGEGALKPRKPVEIPGSVLSGIRMDSVKW